MFIDIQFAEGFLAQETGNGPSEASGITAFSTDSTDPESWLKDPEGITWLVEEKRSPTVQKFTGTLSHVPSSVGGLCSDTVHAFAHFVYDSTDGKLIMADSTACIYHCADDNIALGTWVSKNGKNFLVLFDPMSHTIDG